MINKELKNMAEEIETLNADDKKLRQMLGGLKKVGAPKNFDFQLKARIARAEPNSLRKPFLVPWLRYVLPLSMIVMLAGFAFFNLSFSTGNQNMPYVASDSKPIQSKPAPPETIVKPSVEESSIALTDATKKNETKTDIPETVNLPKKAAQNNPKYVAVKSESFKQSKKIEDDSKNGFGGTRQSTLRNSRVITQPNVNPNSGAAKPMNAGQNKISIQQVLSQIGIEADYADKSWKIVSIKENSLAMRAGMKAGDLIEAIDDKKLSSNTVFQQAFTGKVF
ncbi:MAG: hypothetical protein H0U50_05940, partial [Pyrinomonadaceae bacterium]|nr:hypothetical protein [Pyrinomonadaceae bacterium]